jgi:hypothetical protein
MLAPKGSLWLANCLQNLAGGRITGRRPRRDDPVPASFVPELSPVREGHLPAGGADRVLASRSSWKQ